MVDGLGDCLVLAIPSKPECLINKANMVASTVATSSTAVTLAPLSEQFKAPVTEFEHEVTNEQHGYICDFEKAWADFLSRNPEQTPMGEREENIRKLQEEIQQEILSRDCLVEELKQQVCSIETAKTEHEKQMKEIIQKEHTSHLESESKIKRQLDQVARIEDLQVETLEWFNFWRMLESASKVAGEKNEPQIQSLAKTLLDAGSEEDNKYTPSDHQISAVECELFAMHKKMLLKEMQRIELTMDSHSWIGEVLTACNIQSKKKPALVK